MNKKTWITITLILAVLPLFYPFGYLSFVKNQYEIIGSFQNAQVTQLDGSIVYPEPIDYAMDRIQRLIGTEMEAGGSQYVITFASRDHTFSPAYMYFRIRSENREGLRAFSDSILKNYFSLVSEKMVQEAIQNYQEEIKGVAAANDLVRNFDISSSTPGLSTLDRLHLFEQKERLGLRFRALEHALDKGNTFTARYNGVPEIHLVSEGESLRRQLFLSALLCSIGVLLVSWRARMRFHPKAD